MVAYFLRHADAEPRASSDHERKLTSKGREQAEKVGKFVAALRIVAGDYSYEPPCAGAADREDRRRSTG